MVPVLSLRSLYVPACLAQPPQPPLVRTAHRHLRSVSPRGLSSFFIDISRERSFMPFLQRARFAFMLLSLLSARHLCGQARTSSREPSQELIATATIVTEDAFDEEVYLPVVVNGHKATLLVNMFGKGQLTISPSKMVQVGIPLPDNATLDSLTVGTVTEHSVAVQTVQQSFSESDRPEFPPVIGILGGVLANHDVVVDYPHHQIRLYRLASPAVAHTAPPGMNHADCTSLRSLAPSVWAFDLHAHGHRLTAVVMDQTYNKMNSRAATVLGLTAGTPNVRSLPADVVERTDGKGNPVELQARDLHLQLGKQMLTDVPYNIFPHLMGDGQAGLDPRIFINLQAVAHQLLYLSPSTKRACLQEE